MITFSLYSFPTMRFNNIDPPRVLVKKKNQWNLSRTVHPRPNLSHIVNPGICSQARFYPRLGGSLYFCSWVRFYPRLGRGIHLLLRPVLSTFKGSLYFCSWARFHPRLARGIHLFLYPVLLLCAILFTCVRNIEDLEHYIPLNLAYSRLLCLHNLYLCPEFSQAYMCPDLSS